MPVDDSAPPSIKELRVQFKEHLEAIPDFEPWIQSGVLQPVGDGWFEVARGTLPPELGKYVTLRMRGGKAQFKPIKLTKQLQALRDRL
jgi:hypothetical protein